MDLGSFAALAGIVEPFLADEAGLTAQSTLASLAMADEELFGGVAPGVFEYASTRSAELVGMKWIDGQLVPNPNAEWQIEETTRLMIRDAVVKAYQEGTYPEDLAVFLEEAGPFSEARADMIARTELSFANAEGNRIGIEATGLKKELEKRSSMSDDHDPALECACEDNEDAGWIPYEEPYPSGDISYPFHPRCNCAEIYRQAGSADDLEDAPF